MKKEFSVVFPCFNEADTLPELIQKITRSIGDKKNIEVIFVNNGSTDKTLVVLRKHIKSLEEGNLKIVNLRKNNGYGNGILTGLRNSSGQFIGWSHADSQYDPEVVIKGFEILQAGNETMTFLKGRRTHRSLLDSFFTAGMSIFASVMLSTKLHDINAQPKLFPRKFLSIIDDGPKDFSLDLYALYQAKKNGYVIREIPVSFKKRMYGVAKGGGRIDLKWKLTIRTLRYILKLKNEVYKNQN